MQDRAVEHLLFESGGMRARPSIALLMVMLMASAPLSGCFGEESEDADSTDLEVNPEVLVAGEVQLVSLSAKSKMSVYIPYLIRDPGTGFMQNSTVIDLEKGEDLSLEVLVPPRTEGVFFLVGEFGRIHWPIREQSESWGSWQSRGGPDGMDGQGAIRTPANNSTFDGLEVHSSVMGGSVSMKFVPSIRQASVSVEEGGSHSTGLVHGRTVYDRLFELTDPTDTLDPIDGKAGYFDRWAGQGNAAYEDAALYIIGELEGFGLEVIAHRYEYTDIMNVQNPEAYNICAYKWGSVVPDEWMVFGAHFDVAPPANAVLLDPHVVGFRTYGTRVGALITQRGRQW